MAKFNLLASGWDKQREVANVKENAIVEYNGNRLEVAIVKFEDGSTGYVLQRVFNADKRIIVTADEDGNAVLGKGWEVSPSGFINDLRSKQAAGASQAVKLVGDEE